MSHSLSSWRFVGCLPPPPSCDKKAAEARLKGREEKRTACLTWCKRHKMDGDQHVIIQQELGGKCRNHFWALFDCRQSWHSSWFTRLRTPPGGQDETKSGWELCADPSVTRGGAVSGRMTKCLGPSVMRVIQTTLGTISSMWLLLETPHMQILGLLGKTDKQGGLVREKKGDGGEGRGGGTSLIDECF